MWSVRAIDSFVYMSSGNIQRISGISNYIQRSLLTRSLSRKYEKYNKCHVQSTIVHSYIHTVNKCMLLFCLKIFSRLTKSYHYHTHSGPQIRYPTERVKYCASHLCAQKKWATTCFESSILSICPAVRHRLILEWSDLKIRKDRSFVRIALCLGFSLCKMYIHFKEPIKIGNLMDLRGLHVSSRLHRKERKLEKQNCANSINCSLVVVLGVVSLHSFSNRNLSFPQVAQWRGETPFPSGSTSITHANGP